MKLLLVIGAGGFIGATCRYVLSQFIQSKFLSAFPIGTLTVNIIGCLLVGLIFGLSERANIPSEWRLFLVTGLIGGFTTFSAFSIESVALLRDGQYLYLFAYVSASVILGFAATLLGIMIFRLT